MSSRDRCSNEKSDVIPAGTPSMPYTGPRPVQAGGGLLRAKRFGKLENSAHRYSATGRFQTTDDSLLAKIYLGELSFTQSLLY